MPRNILPALLPLIMAVLLPGCTCLSTKKQKEAPPLPNPFDEISIVTSGKPWPVNVTRTGSRPVLLLHELNGQSPGALHLALLLERAGCKVYVPRFYGDYGADMSPIKWPATIFSPRWRLIAKEGGPIRNDIRDLAIQVQKRDPSRKLTVIGNCMTGGQALALLSVPGIETAVVCQPAAPMLPWTTARKHAFGVPREDVDASIAAMVKDPAKKLVSINYLQDPVAIIARTAYLAGLTQNAGVARQHKLRIAVPAGPHPEVPASIATHPGYRPIKSNDTCAHPTVTSARDLSDRAAFRAALFEELHLRIPADLP